MVPNGWRVMAVLNKQNASRNLDWS